MPTLSEHLVRRIAFEPPVLPDLAPLAATVRRVLNRWPDVELPLEQTREAILAAVRDREATDHWKGLPLSAVTSAARVLYLPEFRDRPDLRRLRRFYPEEIRASTRQGFLGAMAAVYVETYIPGAAHSSELGQALGTVHDRLGGRWSALLTRFPNFFDPTRAQEDIARQMQAMDDPWSELREIGIRRPDGDGLMTAVHLAFVRDLAPRLRERETIDRLLRWLKPDSQSEARIAGAGAALDALLSPWKNMSPDHDLKSYLTAKINALYGHPRIGRHKAVWNETSAAAQAIVLRWLTGENIRFFLDVVTTVEKSHMWEPRRKFWLGLYEQDRIRDAWVAFHPEAERVARRRSVGSSLSFGKQVAGGSRGDTSLLVLEFNDFIVVEGSHTYKVHVFDKHNIKTPKLHQLYYDCEAIRHLPHLAAIPHLPNWEGRLLDAIRTR